MRRSAGFTICCSSLARRRFALWGLHERRTTAVSTATSRKTSHPVVLHLQHLSPECYLSYHNPSPLATAVEQQLAQRLCGMSAVKCALLHVLSQEPSHWGADLLALLKTVDPPDGVEPNATAWRGLTQTLRFFIENAIVQAKNGGEKSCTSEFFRCWKELVSSYLFRVLSAPLEVDKAIVHSLALLLVQAVELESGISEEARTSLSRMFSASLGEAPHYYVAAIISALQIPPSHQSGGVQYCSWHPLVTSSLATACYQRIISAVKAVKQHPCAVVLFPSYSSTVRSWPDGEAELHAVHQCVLPTAPCDCNEETKDALAVLAMSCLRFARWRSLCSLYDCFLSRQPSTLLLIQSKFLANCGSSILSPSARLHERYRPLIHSAFTAVAGSISLKSVEEGVVHGCAALHALGDDAMVRTVYLHHPTLRETAYSVASRIALEDISGCLSAITALGRSQPSGWMYIPAVVAEVLGSASHLVGRNGTPEDIGELYAALIAFRNKGMIVSSFIECTIGGVAHRVSQLSLQLEGSSTLTLKEVLQCVTPMIEKSLAFLGDEINADLLLKLVEATVRAGKYAVALTIGLINVLKRGSAHHLSVRHFFFDRVDATTAHLPFIMYFAICVARDAQLRDVFEHLMTVWSAAYPQVPATAASLIWKRATHLSPAYKLWLCSGCGRVNSDRFNYCACSALRSGFVICAHCDFPQDERWPSCLSCNTPASSKPLRSLVRRSWVCPHCSATNSARQVLMCFRCMKPNPRLQALERPGGTPASTPESFCRCPYGQTGVVSYTTCAAYCRACHVFRDPYSANNSYFWRCCSCHQLRSSLERTCPRCPQVECVPFLYSHSVHDTRCCRHCGASHTDPFADSCSQCGKASSAAEGPVLSITMESDEVKDTEDPVTERPPETITCGKCHWSATDGVSRSALVCPSCLNCLYSADDVRRRLAECLKEDSGNELLVSIANALHNAIVEKQSVNDMMENTSASESCSDLYTSLEPVWKAVSPPQLKPGTESETATIFLDSEQRGMLVERFSSALQNIGAYLAASQKARRTAACMIHFLVALGANLGDVTGSRCPMCLGSHPVAVCPCNTGNWSCDSCEHVNDNAGLSRYVCGNCLLLRPAIQAMQMSYCWRCSRCFHYSPELEAFCITCGLERSHAAESADGADCIPFAPSRCTSCQELFLEATCTRCCPTNSPSSPLSPSCAAKPGAHDRAIVHPPRKLGENSSATEMDVNIFSDFRTHHQTSSPGRSLHIERD